LLILSNSFNSPSLLDTRKNQTKPNLKIITTWKLELPEDTTKNTHTHTHTHKQQQQKTDFRQYPNALLSRPRGWGK
jgi:hypothetical protein